MDRHFALALGAVLLVVGSGAGIVLVGGLPGGGPADAGAPISFQQAPDNAGIDYQSLGSSVNGNASTYAADYDGDGWTDLLTVGSSDGPVLWHNANGTFERSGALPDVGMDVRAAVWLDYDLDDRSDLLLLPDDEEPVLLANRGGGEFEVSGDAPDTTLTFPTGASVADFDGDGCPGVYVIQSGDWRERTPTGWSQTGFVRDDNGEPNLLFRGQCGDGFTNATADAGISGVHWSLATSAIDVTDDGHPDIHVANDYHNDTLYVNQGDGTFERRSLAGPTDRNGMSSEVADFDGDGVPDIFVTNIYVPLENSTLKDTERYQIIQNFMENRLNKRAEGNTLLISQGNGSFAYRAEEYGLRKGGWGWAASAADLNNDGREDVFHATQRFFRVWPDNPIYTYPQVFRNTGDGFRKLNSSAIGLSETDGRGAAELDYDRDGDRDLVVAQYNEDVVVYENTVDAGAYLDVRVERANATALGASVSVTAEGRTQHAFNNGKSDYLSQDSGVLHFGLGDADAVDELTVEWSNGSTTVYRDVAVNGTVTVTPGSLERSEPA